MNLTLAAGLFVAASAAAFAQAPDSSATQRTSPQRQGSTSSPQQNSVPGEQTLTGCLTSADRIYTLTVMDHSGAPGTTAQTTSYTLAPGASVDLQPYLNKRVTVKGTDAGPDAQTPSHAEMKLPAPAATRTSGTGATASKASPSSSGSGTPQSQASATARVNSKAFNVTTVQPASGNCGA